jgi:hypothetical protein
MSVPIWSAGDNTKYAGKKADQSAPVAGTRYNPPAAMKATNTVSAIPASPWKDRDNSITSRQPASKGPFQSDTSFWPESLDPKLARPSKTDRSGSFFK